MKNSKISSRETVKTGTIYPLSRWQSFVEKLSRILKSLFRRGK